MPSSRKLVLFLAGLMAITAFMPGVAASAAPASPPATKTGGVPFHKHVEVRDAHAQSSLANGPTASGATYDTGFHYCNWALIADFNGQVYPDGLISGTWVWNNDTTCSTSMNVMSLDSNATSNFGNVTAGTGDYCNINSSSCTSVIGNGAISCTYCQGTWEFVSGHYMSFVADIDFSSVDPSYCDTIDSQTVRCFNDIITTL